MAIIKIPSQHIYRIDNPKITGNLINTVETNFTIVSPNNQTETNVYSKSLPLDNTFKGDLISDKKYSSTTSYSTFVEAGVYVDIVPKTITGTIIISKSIKNGIINSIYSGKKDEYTNFISHSVSYRINKAPITGILTIDENSVASVNNISDVNSSQIEYGKIQTSNISDSLINEYSVTAVTVSPVVPVTASAKVVAEDTTNLGTVEVSEFDEYFQFDYSIYVGSTQRKLGLANTYASGQPIPTEKALKGYWYDYEPLSVEISVYGDTIEISLEDGSVSYTIDENNTIVVGTGKNPFSIESNELIQDSSTIGVDLTTVHLAGTIIRKYENGKEVATLLCDIADYFDESGAKIIGINMQDRMCFHLHDNVIPYVYSVVGDSRQDKPMSKMLDGTPKIFEVIGTKIFYDGAVWQELKLQEI